MTNMREKPWETWGMQVPHECMWPGGNRLAENYRNNLGFFYGSRENSLEFLRLFQKEVRASASKCLIIWKKRTSVNISPYILTSLKHSCTSLLLSIIINCYGSVPFRSPDVCHQKMNVVPQELMKSWENKQNKPTTKPNQNKQTYKILKN